MGLCANMHQIQQIAARIVMIGLRVVGNLARVGGQWLQIGQGGAAAAGFGLTPRGVDQLIKRVVAVGFDRLDALIVEVADRLGSIFKAQYVADGVVAVFQVLQRRAVGFVGAEANEAAIGRVVEVAGDHAVAGGFRFDLAGGVVLEVADQRSFCPAGTGQGQSRVVQFARDGVGNTLMITQRIDLPEQFAAGSIMQCGGGAASGFK
ncbi:hypothetical protein D3C81_1436460 [compost metagenome]